jgi:hypothetical protein
MCFWRRTGASVGQPGGTEYDVAAEDYFLMAASSQDLTSS